MWLWGHLNFFKFFWNFFEIEFRHPSHTQGYCLGWSLWFGPDVHFLNSDPKIGFVRFSRENGRDCILNVILRSPQFFKIFSQNSHFDIWQIKGYCLGFQCDFGLNSNFLNFEPKIRFVRFLCEKGQYCILNVILRSPQFFKFFRETHISPFGIIQGYCLGFQCDFALNSNSLNSDPKLGFVHFSRQNGRDCIQNVTLRSPQFFEIFLKFFWNWVSTSVAYTRVLPWMITVIWAWCPFSKFWPENRIRSFFAWKWSWLHTKCDFEVTSIF